LGAILKLSFNLSHPTYQAAYGRFTPSDSGQRSPPTYYRGCWHVVGRGLFRRYRQSRQVGTFFPPKRGLQPEGLHPSRGVAASGFRPLRKILDCSLP